LSKATRKTDIQAAALVDLTGMMQRLLRVPEREALALARTLYTDMRRQWGGRAMHFHSLQVSEQAPAILAAWQGNNAQEVCARFGISRSALYNLLACERNKVRAEK